MDYRIFIVDLGFESRPKDYVPSILARERRLMPNFLLLVAEYRTFVLWISFSSVNKLVRCANPQSY